MPKTSKKVEVVETEPEKVTISPIGLDLGREDLNQLVAKVNEVIQFLNK